MFVVGSGDYGVSCVAESYGEDSGGVGAVKDGSVDDLPGLAAVGGVEDAGDFASGGEPDVAVGCGCSNRNPRQDCDASVAGGEGAFPLERGGQVGRRELLPGMAVGGE